MFGFLDRLKIKVMWYIYNHFIAKLMFSRQLRDKYYRQEFFLYAFRSLYVNGIDGDYAEFGCNGGNTFGLAYHEAKRQGYPAKLWAFDSFQGFPASEGIKDEHPAWIKGTMLTTLDQFYRLCDLNKIPRQAYTVVPGFYKQSLARDTTVNLPDNISLAFIDCDLYSSTKSVLEFLMPIIKHGMIIAFDDYFCWSKSQIAGERRAMLEMFSNHPRWELLPYMHFGWGGSSFIVEDKLIINS